MPNLSDAGKREEENSVSKQHATVSEALPGSRKSIVWDWDEEEEELAKITKDIEASNARQANESQALEDKAASLRQEPDLIKRAGQMFADGMIDYPDVKMVRQNDMLTQQPLVTDENKNRVLDVLFGFDRARIKRTCKESTTSVGKLMDGPTFTKLAADAQRPHRNTFKGRIVDHNGEIIDDHYPVSAWIKTFSSAMVKGVSAKAARDGIKEWALEHKWNDLIERLNVAIPKWDGKSRLETKLIELFEPHDTDLNRMFGKYFWLSLYGRVMHPGIYAPMVLSLFGAQDCGKSYFGKRLAQIILGDDAADSVQLNLDAKPVDFLREITGFSVVASVGEMTGFTRGDLNKIKDFITRTSDKMHHKFEGHFDQQRQWITVMDGNKYEGLQRDETGNRRFYPMFCGQMPDEGGQPRWRSDFSACFESKDHGISFEADVWQLLAEAHEWFLENGKETYVRFARDVGRKVAEFSRREIAAERGTISDETVGPYIDAVLRKVDKLIITKPDGKTFVGVKREDLFAAMDEAAGYKVSATQGFGIGLNKAMKARGGGDKTFLPIKIKDGSHWKRTTTPGYKFLECKDVQVFIQSLDSRVGVTGDEDYLEAEVESGF